MGTYISPFHLRPLPSRVYISRTFAHARALFVSLSRARAHTRSPFFSLVPSRALSCIRALSPGLSLSLSLSCAHIVSRALATLSAHTILQQTKTLRHALQHTT